MRVDELLGVAEVGGRITTLCTILSVPRPRITWLSGAFKISVENESVRKLMNNKLCKVPTAGSSKEDRDSTKVLRSKRARGRTMAVPVE